MLEDLSIPANVLLCRLVPLVSQDVQLLAILRGLADEFLKLTSVRPKNGALPYFSAKASGRSIAKMERTMAGRAR